MRGVHPVRHRVRVGERPEPPAELDLVVVGQLLVAEEEHLVAAHGVADRRDLLVGRPADVQTHHLGTEGRPQPVQGQLGGAGLLRLGHRDAPCPRPDARSTMVSP